MKILDYKEFNHSITNYLYNKCCITEIINEKDKFNYIVNKIIKRKNINKEYICNLSVVELDNFSIIRYQIEDENPKANILLTSNNKKLFELEEYSSNNNKVNTEKSEFTIYNPNTSKIKCKMGIDKLELKNNTQIYRINMLYSGTNGRYNKNNYELYIENDDILFLRKNNEDYIPDEESIDYNVKTTIDAIERFSEMISSSFYSILDNEQIKEYIPNRQKERYLTKISRKR